MMVKYLVDASAIYPLIVKLREELLTYMDMFVVLDLTKYEVGNVLWKEYKGGRIKDLGSIVALFEMVFDSFGKLSIDRLDGVLRIAVERDLTFYDASYVYVAEKMGMSLVTEDHEILEKCSNAVNLETLLGMLSKN